MNQYSKLVPQNNSVALQSISARAVKPGDLRRQKVAARWQKLQAEAEARTDPVVALYRRHVALEAASVPLEARAKLLWEKLAARYGDPLVADWTVDSDHSKLVQLNEKCDTITMGQGDLLDKMLETKATTAEGAVAKLKASLSLWRGMDREKMENMERETLSLIEDAIGVLSRGAGQ